MSQSLRTRLENKQGGAGIDKTVAATAQLLQKGDDLIAGAAKDAKNLLLTQIESDPNQPRRHFDPKELQELADDIGQRGILQPILVHPPTDTNDLYVIIAGERRWRASKIAGKTRIPVLIRAMTDEERRAAQLVENILRTNLSDIEKGRALRALYDLRKTENPKTTWEDVVAEVGLKRARINDLYNLSQLPDAVAELIQCGRLSGSHGIALQRVQEKLGAEAISEIAEEAARPEGAVGVGYGLTVSELRRAIQERVAPSREPAPVPESAVEPASDVNRSSVYVTEKADALPSPSSDIAFVERTLELLRANQLPKSYRDQLLQALNGGQTA